MKTWRECYFEPRQLTSDKYDQYFEVYDERFDRHRAKPIPVYIEIGCQGGGSLETARRYFGDKAKIYGIDVDKACDTLNKVPFIDKVFIGDQGNQIFLESVLAETGAPDMILDDASHHSYDILVSFLVMFPKLANGGTYLIEDTFCTYWPTHQKLLHGQSVFDFFNSLTDKLSLNMWIQHLTEGRYLVPRDKREGRVEQKSGIVKDIRSITFYDGMIAIEKQINDNEPLRHIVPPRTKWPPV